MDSFEETLSQLNREPLPPEWKEELLDTALAADHEQTIVPLFGPISKLALAAIAACWVAIGALLLMTPSGPDTEELANRFGIAPEKVSLLAARFGAPPSGDLRF